MNAVSNVQWTAYRADHRERRYFG